MYEDNNTSLIHDLQIILTFFFSGIAGECKNRNLRKRTVFTLGSQ